MKPSELAIKLEELRSRFEEEWDPEDVKSVAEFIIEHGGPFVIALHHHEALVELATRALRAHCLPDCQCADRQLLATIERETR